MVEDCAGVGDADEVADVDAAVEAAGAADDVDTTPGATADDVPSCVVVDGARVVVLATSVYVSLRTAADVVEVAASAPDEADVVVPTPNAVVEAAVLGAPEVEPDDDVTAAVPWAPEVEPDDDVVAAVLWAPEVEPDKVVEAAVLGAEDVEPNDVVVAVAVVLKGTAEVPGKLGVTDAVVPKVEDDVVGVVVVAKDTCSAEIAHAPLASWP